MKHRVGFNRLSRSAAHRLSLHRNMATSLFRYERITTTKAKALAVRRTAEKMITRAKVDSVHNRRTIAKDIKDKEILAKLFTEIGPRFVSRPGGYTRILKLGRRKGDAAEMVILELVEKKQEEKKPAKAKKAKAVKEDKKAEAPKAEAEAVPAEEEKKEAAPAAE
ncbi:50S ribosomal protein L17 [Sediminispirochaeta smaragdinae]|uniref:Large ribosomal subunit protein bL17 n=1 Tax=Sediminispirochaeta smaragdinae (strain DSM 11293 / JCM 15392 / SEBR 4228) TaxID=573413 RepID=E1RCN5_SEDSS|nr:50S ribosomal protein L17 [Sediminispirochaeta smaragdinae]ADK80115.1 ribosomal protein L17 [Sediminispirochaeta smaragdinae DSM 11293]